MDKIKSGGYVSGRVIVRFKTDTSESSRRALVARSNAEVERDIKALDVLVLKIPEAAVEPLIKALSKNPLVEYAERDSIAKAMQTNPNDPYWPQQAGSVKVQCPAAWDISKGSANTIIAILDSGAYMNHPDLASKFVSSGANLINNQPMYDTYGHGTWTCGVAAADTDNSTGVAAYGWHCRILPVKVLDDTGSGPWSVVASGIVYAADNSASIINLSLAGDQPAQVLLDAVRYALTKNSLVVGAAGNNSTNTPYYPAAYPECMGVAGSAPDDTVHPDSNYGDWVDLAAPYTNYTTGLNDGYVFFNGTSSACPAVSGVAGLVRAYKPRLLARQVRSLINSTCDPMTFADSTKTIPNGRINAFAALQAASVLPAAPAAAPTNCVALGGANQISLSWDLVTGADAYVIRRAKFGEPYSIISDNVTNTSYIDGSLSSSTAYYYRVSALNAGGEGPLSNEFSAATSDSGAPQVPTGLQATVVSASQINVSWNSSTNATSYDLERSGIVITNVSSPYADAGLAANTTYSYRVRAVNANGVSAWSASVSATTSGTAATAVIDRWDGTNLVRQKVYKWDGSVLIEQTIE